MTQRRFLDEGDAWAWSRPQVLQFLPRDYRAREGWSLHEQSLWTPSGNADGGIMVLLHDRRVVAQATVWRDDHNYSYATVYIEETADEQVHPAGLGSPGL